MTKLQRQFRTYNRLWFSNTLPADTEVKWKRIKMLGTFSITEGISINVTMKHWTSVWKQTLLHEMAHLATESEVEHHGPRWQKLMRSLAKRGAFDKLW